MWLIPKSVWMWTCRCVAPACIPNKIADPLLFYTNVCGNVEKAYTRDELDSRLKADAWRCKCGAMATGKFCPECGDIFDDNEKNKTAA